MQDPLCSVVVDRITIGHPCCGVHNCTIPLESARNRFCQRHQEYEQVCSVVDCDAIVESGFKTCTKGAHRDYELHVRERGKAMFQLKDHLKRINSYQTHNALSADTPIAVDEGGALKGSGIGKDCKVQIDKEGNKCDGKLALGNRKVKARFGRRRTHNEELCVASCGIILGRCHAPDIFRFSFLLIFFTSSLKTLRNGHLCVIGAHKELQRVQLPDYKSTRRYSLLSGGWGIIYKRWTYTTTGYSTLTLG